jgi:hypothetical protein
MEGLKDKITKEVSLMFEGILDIAQVAIPPYNYKVFRSKVLRAGNNCIRYLHKYIDDNE